MFCSVLSQSFPPRPPEGPSLLKTYDEIIDPYIVVTLIINDS